MRFIPTKLHAALDYAGGLLLIIAPLFYLNDEHVPDAAVWVPMAVGALMLGQALLTNYEFSAVDLIPVPVHLLMDALAGALLIASPWLFGFHEDVWIPHVALGVLEIGAALTTELHRRDLRETGRHTAAAA